MARDADLLAIDAPFLERVIEQKADRESDVDRALPELVGKGDGS
jgi:hypothetical protein